MGWVRMGPLPGSECLFQCTREVLNGKHLYNCINHCFPNWVSGPTRWVVSPFQVGHKAPSATAIENMGRWNDGKGAGGVVVLLVKI